MSEYDTHEWQEFIEARNELEAANEYHISLVDKYSSHTTFMSAGEPLTVMSEAAKSEMAAAEERLEAARERFRLAQGRLQ